MAVTVSTIIRRLWGHLFGRPAKASAHAAEHLKGSVDGVSTVEEDVGAAPPPSALVTATATATAAATAADRTTRAASIDNADDLHLLGDADVDDQLDEADEVGLEDDEELLADLPDFFVVAAPREPVALQGISDLETVRTASRVAALTGEHRIYPSSPTGPGSLAEALTQLLIEDQVSAGFVDDGVSEPYLLYTPRRTGAV